MPGRTSRPTNQCSVRLDSLLSVLRTVQYVCVLTAAPLVISLFKCKWDLLWIVGYCRVHKDYSLSNLCSSTLRVCVRLHVCVGAQLSAGGY